MTREREGERKGCQRRDSGGRGRPACPHGIAEKAVENAPKPTVPV